MINKKTKNNPIKRPIRGVVPQFGETFPYSIFNGLRISPNLVFNAIRRFEKLEIM